MDTPLCADWALLCREGGWSEGVWAGATTRELTGVLLAVSEPVRVEVSGGDLFCFWVLFVVTLWPEVAHGGSVTLSKV